MMRSFIRLRGEVIFCVNLIRGLISERLTIPSSDILIFLS